MTDIILTLDAAEAAAVDAALAEYRGALLKAQSQGGVAAEIAETMAPFASRVEQRLHEQMYELAAEVEPDWNMPESADPVSRYKAEVDRLGDYPAGVSYHDYQAAR